jgi:hypothetical protein
VKAPLDLFLGSFLRIAYLMEPSKVRGTILSVIGMRKGGRLRQCELLHTDPTRQADRGHDLY